MVGVRASYRRLIARKNCLVRLTLSILTVNTKSSGSRFRIDPSDLSLSTFFTEMHKHLANIAPDWTQFLVDRSAEEDLPDSQTFGSQFTSSQRSSSSFWDPPSPPEGLENSQKVLSQKSSSQSVSGKPKGAVHEPIPLIRKKSSSRSIQDLPFMRREVDLTKRKYGPDNYICFFSVSICKICVWMSDFLNTEAAHNGSQEEDRVQIKIRQPLSPTTPRTRYERDYGFSLAGIGLTPHRNENLLSPHRTEEVLVEDDIEGVRTPRRVRRLMMETTPTHNRLDATPTHRRPRRNLTESLLAAAAEGPTRRRTRRMAALDRGDHEERQEEDLDLDGLFNDIKPVEPLADIIGGDSDGEGIDAFR
ncbi:hypothetical protein BX666DRAFT_1408316 [Dichotomocladium elegans]|nr:hypothetical protein BX666DRAFT_1408316 [Dichotomocladium elegans]